MNRQMDMDGERKTELARLVSRVFTLPGSKIEELIEQSEEFREMCLEYEKCQEMVKRWRTTLPKHLSRIDEFQTLSREMEAEITRFFEEHTDNEGPGDNDASG